jgi:hypothetical protein
MGIVAIAACRDVSSSLWTEWRVMASSLIAAWSTEPMDDMGLLG